MASVYLSTASTRCHVDCSSGVGRASATKPMHVAMEACSLDELKLTLKIDEDVHAGGRVVAAIVEHFQQVAHRSAAADGAPSSNASCRC
jgi:hypothetical protein